MDPVFHRILVAVRDVAHAPRHALAKAGEIARATGAPVELFHAITELAPAERIRLGRGRPGASEQMETIRAYAEERLGRMARLMALRGTRVSVHAEWDYPAHEAIVRRSVTARADLVVAETRHHAAAARLVLLNTDWELVRHLPCSVLLVKTARPYSRRAIVVAVDPLHAHDKPAVLDRRLLESGSLLASSLGVPLHAFHAYLPISIQVMMSVMDPAPVWVPEETERKHAHAIRHALERVARHAGIPASLCELVQGDVADGLATTVRRLRASLVVMGAVSRSALKRLFIGATAERVINELDCDILVVKPKGFRTDVPRRTLPRVAAVGPVIY